MLKDLVLDGLTNGRARFAGEDHWSPAVTVADGGTRLFGSDAASSTVGAVLTNDRATAELVIGAITTGSRLVSLPLPPRAADIAVYQAHLEEIVGTFGVEEIVARDDAASLLTAIGLPARAHSTLAERPVASASASEQGFELVQFTSGSTGNPKPIVLTDAALEANIRAVLGRIAPTDEDRVITWLPLSHDLGLIAMFLAPIIGGGSSWAGGGDLMVMDPEQFLRNPRIWTESLSEHRGTITAAPDFALRMAASQPPTPATDLSALRCMVIGGEIIRPDTLRTFASAFGDRGFDSTALSPAYGLAEVGVAVTLCAPEEHWTSHRISIDGVTDPSSGHGAPQFEVVACGTTISGYQVETDSSDGTIRIEGPSTGINGLSGQTLADSDGWLTTGDAGTLRDGQLLVVGRHDDTVVVNGRNVFAPPLEQAIGAIDGVRPGRVAITGLPSGGWIVALEELRGTDSAQRAQIRANVRSETASLAGIRPDEIAILPPGALPMTASGKLQRRELQRRFATGALGGH